jgi:lipopolysaccharide transport system permease protein
MLKETRYSPQSMPNGVLPSFKAILKDFYLGHNLGKQLFNRDLKAQYRQSFLGVFWAFAPAFVTAALWIFLNSFKVVKVETAEMSYALYATTGLMFWQILTQSITTTMNTINSGKPLLTKLNFPRESLLIHAFYNIGFNALISLIVAFSLSGFMGWHPTWSLLFLPIIILNLMLVGIALGVLFYSIFSLIADFSKLVNIALQFAMYVSAVVFPMPKENNLASLIFKINPFTHLIVFARNIYVGLPIEAPLPFIIISIISLVLLLVGLLMYRITMPIIIERMGS